MDEAATMSRVKSRQQPTTRSVSGRGADSGAAWRPWSVSRIRSTQRLLISSSRSPVKVSPAAK